MKAVLVLLLLVATFASGQSPSAEDSSRCRFAMDSLTKRVLCRNPDKAAEFKGGSNAFNDMMQQRFHYDRSLLEHRFTLIVQFVVEPDGNIGNLSLMRTPPDLPTAILDGLMKFFKQMPRRSYQPALCGKQPVACLVRQPVILLP